MIHSLPPISTEAGNKMSEFMVMVTHKQQGLVCQATWLPAHPGQIKQQLPVCLPSLIKCG